MIHANRLAIWTAVANILIVLVIGFVLFDNLAGFRKAEAIAGLLSALFTGLSFAWLIFAAMTQQAELKLQREEIAFQASHTKLMAQELANQVKLSRIQIATALQAQISPHIYAILTNNPDAYNAIFQKTKERAENRFKSIVKGNILFHSVSFYQYGIKVSYKTEKTDKSRLIKFKDIQKVRVFEIHERPILTSHRLCKEYDLEDWFLRVMPLTFAPSDEIGQGAMFVAINMICLHDA